MVELLFLPSVYAPCPTCHGARYNAKTLEIEYRGQIDRRRARHDGRRGLRSSSPTTPHAARARSACCARSALGYLRLGQPATELSGGEAQRIKLATELQRMQRGETLYVLDEPTTGLHPADVEQLLAQLDGLVDAGNTVIVVEHDMRVVAAQRLGHRHRPRRGRRGRPRGRGRHAGRGCPLPQQPDRALLGTDACACRWPRGRWPRGVRSPACGYLKSSGARSRK